MRVFFNISNGIGILGILLLFLFGLYRIIWANDLFPFTYLLIIIMLAAGPFAGVLLNRRSSKYIYGIMSLLNFFNIFCLAYGFFNYHFVEQFWSLQIFLANLIIFLGLLFFLNRFTTIFTRVVQILILGNIAINSYFLIATNYNDFLYSIIFIYSSITFILSLLTISFQYKKTKDINKDKSQIHKDAEASKLTS
jgi:hypothetical protein